MAKSGQSDVRQLLSAGGFRRLLIGQAVSGLGDWVATLAFIAIAFNLTHNQTAVAVVLVLRLVPPIFAAPIGGFLADRMDRRLIMVSSDVARGILICFVPFTGIAGVYIIAFLHECISLLFLPARDASVPTLVKEENLPLANGFVLGSSYGSIPFAAALFGGLSIVAKHFPESWPLHELVQNHQIAFAFFFDAATFAVSATMIAGIALPRGEEGESLHLFSGLAEGFRHVWRTPLLRSLAEGLLVSMFGGGVLFAIGIAYIHLTLGGSDVQFGWLAALWGAGMGLGLGAVRPLINREGAAPLVLLAVTACGGILIVMALLPFLWLAFIVAVLFGAAFSVAITVALSIAQRATEDRLRGRIMAGVQMLFRVGLGAGALGMGGIATAIGDTKVHPGIGGLDIEMDANQIALFAGGLIILTGAIAAAGVLRTPKASTEPETLREEAPKAEKGAAS
jgi:dTMP kinase